MNLAYRQRRMLALVIGALVTAGVIIAGIRGSGQTVIAVVLVVALLAAYVVRHYVRARLVYGPQANPPDTTVEAETGPVSAPAQGRSHDVAAAG